MLVCNYIIVIKQTLACMNGWYDGAYTTFSAFNMYEQQKGTFTVCQIFTMKFKQNDFIYYNVRKYACLTEWHKFCTTLASHARLLSLFNKIFMYVDMH